MCLARENLGDDVDPAQVGVGPVGVHLVPVQKPGGVGAPGPLGKTCPSERQKKEKQCRFHMLSSLVMLRVVVVNVLLMCGSLFSLKSFNNLKKNE